ncbi:hypothetical protein ES692_15665 [Psychroserpens burtonensis]|uniref:Uncharacterized protein n=1 Tax=Psychroserpens burtonensis TaxID=49278 RepID=A0A5C7BCM7_9FLAO|nr:PcfJ domain-containing protein [Psychroserpens burtonensis]TXE15714.1 hypothetical protein ES692_15665 [Psychroserpens burtonensis]
MINFEDFYNRPLWYQSEEARALFNDAQLQIIKETIDYIDNQLDFENDLSHIVFWSDYTLVNRLMHWLSLLNNAKGIDSLGYSPLVLATLWAFKNHKPITKQTQHQCDISISLIQEFLSFNIPIGDLDDAKLLLMNVFIWSERPDFVVSSLRKQMFTYSRTDTDNVFNKSYKGLINYLFVKTPLPNFLFPYLIDCSDAEYQLIINILDGKSLRKNMPSDFNLSKSENAILQADNINLPQVKDHILERFVLATRILKEFPDKHEILNIVIFRSRIFIDQIESFRNDLVFWKSVFRFLVINAEEFGYLNTMSHYIDYFEWQRYFSEEPLKYTLKGRTFKSVNRIVGHYHYRYGHMTTYIKYKWKPLPIEKWFSMDETFTYAIEEITDGKRLLDESKALGHCVFTYGESCNNGFVHIFSLSKIRKAIKKSFITIEVRGNLITQIAGKNNQAPSQYVIDLIEEWGAVNSLSIR